MWGKNLLRNESRKSPSSPSQTLKKQNKNRTGAPRECSTPSALNPSSWRHLSVPHSRGDPSYRCDRRRTLEWHEQPEGWDLHVLRCKAMFRLRCGTNSVKTTPQMTRFRGGKVCNNWLQMKIDDHRIQSDYKCISGLQNPEGKNSVLGIASAW